MTTNNVINELKSGLDEKFHTKKSFWSYIPIIKNFVKKKQIKVVIINEDSSTNSYVKALPKSYFFEIDKKSYLLVPKCIMRVDNIPVIYYYFNNPFPIHHKFEYSTFKPIDLKTEEELAKMSFEEKTALASVSIDAESLNLAMNTRFIRGLYFGEGMTTKTILYIIGAVLIAILVILQLTGTVDVMGGMNKILTGR